MVVLSSVIVLEVESGLAVVLFVMLVAAVIVVTVAAVLTVEL